MNEPFSISFYYPLDNSQEIVKLRATARLHQSSHYYVIESFCFDDGKQHEGAMSHFPAIEIEKIKQGSHFIWVHKESNRASQLSLSIGKAIEDRES